MDSSPDQPLATSALLETKLYAPKWRPGSVSRQRLVERIQRGTERKLTIVTAPAGFGKSTLLAEWLAASSQDGSPVGWVSLDQSDNDPTLFWTYLITAFRALQPGGGTSALSLMRSGQNPPIESVITVLINEITAVDRRFTLVLDDFHLIETSAIHASLAFFIDHLPPQTHLLIASRTDPPLPLARMRGSGEVTELRTADLRFTPVEAQRFFGDVMGLTLSAENVEALEQRTEGWIAGLQLAALSLQGRVDVGPFIDAFAGDNRYIVDYLVEEVLLRQPDHVRRFLLQTSILGNLCAPLCDAVTGRNDSKELLEVLERANLFLVPLDDTRHWYRYHHLFADVLGAHLVEEAPDSVNQLHRTASEWHTTEGLVAGGVRHALASEDFDMAADLVERTWAEMDESRQSATWLTWVKALPEAVVRSRPVVNVGYAWALLSSGDLEAAETRLKDAERRLSEAGEGMMVADEQAFGLLPASIASAHAYCAMAIGDLAGTLTHSRHALDLLPDDDHLRRGVPASLLGLAHWSNSDLDGAERSFTNAIESFTLGNSPLFAITGAFVLAQIQVARGRLSDALHTSEQAIRLAEVSGATVIRGTAELHTGLCELHLERNELDAASQQLATSKAIGEAAAMPHWDYRWCVAHARLQEARGNLDSAVTLLDEAERLSIRGPVPDVRPIAAVRARVWIEQGKLGEAAAWAREHQLAFDDAPTYMREFEHVTLAQLLIAQYQAERDDHFILDASGLLERLLKAAEAGGRNGSIIPILVLQALALQATGDAPKAMTPLGRALAMAEPEGYARVFFDHGEPMRQLLRHAAADGIAGAYTQRLLAAFSTPDSPDSPGTNAVPGLAEPLTARQLEILRLIVAGMRNQEIADQLFINLSTVKRHIANAYSKLGVDHRTEAIARLRALNLL